ncbi:protein of unknown function [Methylocella tundrae]|uniref:Uncharacterized protein n=1 Tax=Methylocella tundrae TaxID=227605 RepID=A0A4U8YZJ0_METTU|nr:protein of unknown function [Methylocella tundrae]
MQIRRPRPEWFIRNVPRVSNKASYRLSSKECGPHSEIVTHFESMGSGNASTPHRHDEHTSSFREREAKITRQGTAAPLRSPA